MICDIDTIHKIYDKAYACDYDCMYEHMYIYMGIGKAFVNKFYEYKRQHYQHVPDN